MTVLVLCVDRDNDLGRKAGVTSPVVGREANIEAAKALALADPEDSDANSVFGAVQTFDELVAEGVDAHVVTICGDARVGPLSDRRLTAQLDRVLSELRPDRCVFITDGAEDEYILPLVTSRVRVDAVRRVIVKQHADIEGTYYVIKRALEDDKIQRTIFIPLALGLLVYGIFALVGQTGKGLGAITLTLGVYFLVKALHVGMYARRIVRDLYGGLSAGRVTLFTSMLALLVLAGGLVIAVRRGLELAAAPEPLPWERAGLRALIDTALVWWFIVAAGLSAGGKVLDAYVREGRILWDYWILPFSLVATGLILTAALDMALLITRGENFITVGNVLQIVVAFAVAFLGSASSGYVKELAEARSPRREPAEAEAAAER